MARKRPDQTKRPSFQFYPSDWLRDISLRCVSLEARGLWMDMLCYMHEGQPYGYLKVNLMVIHSHNLSHMTGVNLEVVERLLKELLAAGVCSIDSTGCIYSRRMVRDEEIRKKRADGGIKGGNPSLIKGKNKVNLMDNHTINLSTEDEEEDKEVVNTNSFKLKKECKKEFAPGVKLTDSEDEKLKAEFGIVIVQAAYLFLSSYKIEKSYKTKSDNLTIRRWVIDAVKKQSNGNQQNNLFAANGTTGAGPKLGTSSARTEALRTWGTAYLNGTTWDENSR
jgi:hypothetical protein